ncbi:hypothetical protein R5R35_005885 [Gryllus longicercus]|uniref:Uncharacterized protein n=1 Tax=Gryllus longicercus TaxID=2509291 RepID=A0AAN9VB41_9ORTH
MALVGRLALTYRTARRGSCVSFAASLCLLVAAYPYVRVVAAAAVTTPATNTSQAPKQTEENSNGLICPLSQVNRPIFTLPCKTDADCKILGEQCCKVDGKHRCLKGVPKPKPVPTHTPFLGTYTRECPANPIPETLPIKNCTHDRECWPRICCPDGHDNYCRTPLPKWEETPRLEPLKGMVAYLQCTPPPPPLFDLFPKPCRNILDCFPNICCQEQEKKVCRPAKKSMLALLAQVTQVSMMTITKISKTGKVC